jgi:uncharacterized hydantoinase/oxoprolinase family protein
MLCADLETSTEADRRWLAERVNNRQMFFLTTALADVASRLPGPPQTVVLAGEGEVLGYLAVREQEKFPPCPIVPLGKNLGPEISRAACAFALAVLAVEQGAGE